MKLVIAIVQDDFANKVTRSLMENKYRVTKLSSTGGFLKSGNTTLLIGTENENINEITNLIKEECKEENVSSSKDATAGSYANIFVLNMDEFRKI